ncbi:hypothetical protein PUN28_004098 [Cardiocondyla obscurior]|uniref:Uncharacterized protein n=1 Tax=Cardiocondyla obscurior TaxID=286306 RepID=A0AAW2GPK6_9HYME
MKDEALLSLKHTRVMKRPSLRELALSKSSFLPRQRYFLKIATMLFRQVQPALFFERERRIRPRFKESFAETREDTKMEKGKKREVRTVLVRKKRAGIVVIFYRHRKREIPDDVTNGKGDKRTGERDERATDERHERRRIRTDRKKL